MKLSQHITCCLILLPLITRATAAWSAGTEIDGAPYHTVEELRSFYKLNAGGKTTHKGAYGFGDADVNLELGPGARELRIGGVQIALARPLQRDTAGNLLISREDWVAWVDPILRPTYIAGRTAVKNVIIDPGHGGHDTGARAGGTDEAAITLQVAHKLKTELEKQGYQVSLTRAEDQYLSDRQRADATKGAQNAIFLSLHLNTGRSDYQGASVYTLAPAEPGTQPRPGNTSDPANAALAYALQTALTTGAGAADAGCHHTRFNLLSSVPCPAAWVELGYATNEAEGAALASDEYQNTLAHALAQGIAAYAHVANPATQIPVQAPRPHVTTKAGSGSSAKTTSATETSSRSPQKTAKPQPTPPKRPTTKRNKK